jgi:hypothetical protein
MWDDIDFELKTTLNYLIKNTVTAAASTYSFFVDVPSDSLTTMLGRSRQSEPEAVGICAIRASTRGAMSLQM